MTKNIDEKEARCRVLIQHVTPEIDAGRYPIKRVVGETIQVEADIISDGHDLLSSVVRYRHADAKRFDEVRLESLVNDRWRAEFPVSKVGRYFYTVVAWIDHFGTWLSGLKKKVDAGQDVGIDLQIGASLVRSTADHCKGDNARKLNQYADRLTDSDAAMSLRVQAAQNKELQNLMRDCADRKHATEYSKTLVAVVDRPLAGSSAWYEFFPRSCSEQPNAHGTFKDCERMLPYVASMGFDIVYLPPIHPIGKSYRKGSNNSTQCAPDDPGSPWAIGSAEGGHKSILPALGTMEDFCSFVQRAKEYNLEVALDIAFQCSPDHPYVKEHPQWFRHRPDGTVQYAENPPKKYQDIYPLDFDIDDWQALYLELKSVFEFWIEKGVAVFRVDNPHTKPFAFWEWLITEIKGQYPDVIFLSEAFTRPKTMYTLAKLGFTQSYTYFTWRNNRHELTEYLIELTQTEVREYFRPNFWPNTPDILHETLQTGGRPMFMIRLVLAATLSANYGIYGPAFELCINQPREPGSEEYLNSEKYEIKAWNLQDPNSLRGLIANINRIRKQHTAFQTNQNLLFHEIDNHEIICYSKQSLDRSDTVIVVVNMNSHHIQSGWTNLALHELGLSYDTPFNLYDLLTGARYTWQGAHNYIELDPQGLPAHILAVGA